MSKNVGIYRDTHTGIYNPTHTNSFVQWFFNTSLSVSALVSLVGMWIFFSSGNQRIVHLHS